ncbi:MAG: ribonuclease Y [bacterium]
MNSFIVLLIAVAAFAIGSVLGYLIRQAIAKNQADSAEAKAERTLNEAKVSAKEMQLEAKDRATKILEEAKEQEKERRDQIVRFEQRLEKREKEVDQKSDESNRIRKEIQEKAEKIKEIESNVKNLEKEKINKLQEVASLTKDDAKNILLEEVEKEYKEDILKRVSSLEEEGKNELEARARDIMTYAMQRFASGHSSDTTTTNLAIPSEDAKGKIIGKEGRNIKTLEQLTGVEIVVDDTPGSIIISAFDPIRRFIAKISLERLIADGRIHPAKIEEIVEKVKTELAAKIKEAGEAAIYDVGLTGIDPKLVQLLGRLRFRTSFGQNALLHSLEVAHLSGSIAAELGADVNLAKKAGLFHDIGKAIDHEVQGTHIEIGKMVLKKFGMSEDIIKAMQSHHEDYPFESVEAVIVHVADALSASRPGARKDTLENYLQRLEDLEATATELGGVEKAYAVQAGRELRVFVRPNEIDDLGAKKLAKNIADRIEEELKYPGEIKVTVVREMRVVEYAK